MRTTTLFAPRTLCAFIAVGLLSACSSDGGSTTTTTTPTPVPSTSTPSTSTPSTPVPSISTPKPATIDGVAVSLTKDAKVDFAKSNDLNVLNINGKAITLVPNEKLEEQRYINGVQTDNTTHLEAKDGARIVLNMKDHKDARFGFVKEDGKDVLFYQGNSAANLPAGTVRYLGNALYKYQGTFAGDIERHGTGINEGSVELTADFANKTIKGLMIVNGESITLASGKIEGTTYTNAASGSGAKWSGAFYGDGAKETAGSVVNSSERFGYSAVYGATSK